MKINTKAFTLGLASFFILLIVSELLLASQSPIPGITGALLFNYAIYFIAGAVTAYFAKHNEISNSVIFGIIAAIIMGVYCYIRPLLGLRGDSIGVEGCLLVTFFSLLFSLGLSYFAAVCVRALRSRKLIA